MLQGNLVSKMACLRELQRIFDSSCIFMLAYIGENFEPRSFPSEQVEKLPPKRFTTTMSNEHS